jgi:hypothetical protein
MISFVYKGFTYYANVIEYRQDPPIFHIMILSTQKTIPHKLILVQHATCMELSTYSLPASAELISVIAEKILQHTKSEVA